MNPTFSTMSIPFLELIIQAYERLLRYYERLLCFQERYFAGLPDKDITAEKLSKLRELIQSAKDQLSKSTN